MTSPSPPPIAIKRKRDSLLTEELEINIDAPEPPSRRAQRLAKKGKILPPKPRSPSPPGRREHAKKHEQLAEADSTGRELSPQPSTGHSNSKELRSVPGVWIGNLNWTTDKIALRAVLTERGNIPETAIKRIHMPMPSKESASAVRRPKPAKNKGFAYVDFSTTEAQAQAIALSETLIDGRKLLIKDAQSFDGRPAEHVLNGNDAESQMKGGNPPNKRVFIGNLHFETDRDGLREHFEQCGDVEQTFLATFEDSGKCKGYAWITFADLEGAKVAVRGWVRNRKEIENGNLDVPYDGKPQSSGATKKYWINVHLGRRLRVEFAEDPTVRYQKRYGKGRNNEGAGEE